MKTFALLVSLAAAACSGCASQQLAHKPIEPHVATVDEIISHENELDGQLVTVKGFLQFGNDSRNLWTDRNALRAVSEDYIPLGDPRWKRCIALYDVGQTGRDLRQRHNSDVSITGVVYREVRTPQMINLSYCNELGLLVRSLATTDAAKCSGARQHGVAPTARAAEAIYRADFKRRFPTIPKVPSVTVDDGGDHWVVSEKTGGESKVKEGPNSIELTMGGGELLEMDIDKCTGKILHEVHNR